MEFQSEGPLWGIIGGLGELVCISGATIFLLLMSSHFWIFEIILHRFFLGCVLGGRIDKTYRWGNGGKFKKCMILGRLQRGPDRVHYRNWLREVYMIKSRSCGNQVGALQFARTQHRSWFVL